MSKYLEPVIAHVSDLALERLATQPGACDFRFGNPQEMPLPAIQAAITKWAAPQNKDWFAYKFSDPRATKVAVESLHGRVGIDFDQRDVAMTTGAFGALATTLRAVLDAGDEVIYLSPPWFFYVPMILSCGARPVRVDFEPPRFGLPVDAIDAAITDRTRAIIVNTPHNPSGRVLTPDELTALARVLEGAPRPPTWSPTSPTAASFSTAARTIRRCGSTTSPFSSTPTARRCWRPVSASVTSRCRRPCPTARSCEARFWSRNARSDGRSRTRSCSTRCGTSSKRSSPSPRCSDGATGSSPR
jgi:hypothetical protein